MRNGAGYSLWVPICFIVAVGGVNAAPANSAHELLLSKSAVEQAVMLGKAVGNGCIGTTPFFMGIAESGSAFWSVLCANGHSYVVQVSPDAVGTAAALECSQLKAMHLIAFLCCRQRPCAMLRAGPLLQAPACPLRAYRRHRSLRTRLQSYEAAARDSVGPDRHVESRAPHQYGADFQTIGNFTAPAHHEISVPPLHTTGSPQLGGSCGTGGGGEGRRGRIGGEKSNLTMVFGCRVRAV
jgi:hypothetical protein